MSNFTSVYKSIQLTSHEWVKESFKVQNKPMNFSGIALKKKKIGLQAWTLTNFWELALGMFSMLLTDKIVLYD